MNLAITLPSDIQKRVEDIAAQKGERAETVVIAAVRLYIAHEQQGARPPSDISEALEWSQQLYLGFRERLRQQYPSLKDLPREQLAAMMEKLSEKVAKGMASTTWQEAEAFMRGEDHYDFARQQYLHH